MTHKILNLLAQINVSPDDLNVPQTTDTSSGTIQGAFTLVLGIMGGVAVIVIIIAGIQYMISMAEPQKVNKAKNTIIYALIGLVVVIFAQLIVGFVVTNR